MTKVLVVATGRKTRGGITSVIKAHETGAQWKRYNCVWIQTHRDSNDIVKLWYFGTAILEYLLLLPFCNIVHFHFSEDSTAKRKRMLMAVAKVFGKKIISHFHSYSLDSTIRSPYRHLYEYLFKNSNIVIVLSQYWKNALVEELCLDEAKVKILYNPCPQVETGLKVDNGKVVTKEFTKEILYAGTVCHRKGYDDMIKAFAKVAPQHRDWKIVFAGNGEIEEGKALATEFDIVDQTVFLGWVSGKDKDAAFRHATVFCLPSYAEGFPMGVLDAWAYSLPVITTPVGGIPDIAIDGKNMLLFNPGDIDALAVQMEKIIRNDDLRRSIAAESTLLAHTIFDVQTINRQLGEIYEDLLNK